MMAATRIIRPKRLLPQTSSRRIQHNFFSSAAATVGSANAHSDDDDDDVAYLPPLLEFSRARLQYPSSTLSTQQQQRQQTFDFPIYAPDLKASPKQGGYAVLGRNGSGKSLLGAALRATADNVDLSRQSDNSQGKNDNKNPYVTSGTLSIPTASRWHSRAVAHVSFDSHRELLQETDDKTGDHVTAFKAIATAGGAPGKLNAAAQFLVVRFGLYPLLHRTVNTLSTGEIRKVL